MYHAYQNFPSVKNRKEWKMNNFFGINLLKPINFCFPLKASKGELQVECNPELLTTTSMTSTTFAGGGITSKNPNSANNTNNHTSGGHGHSNNIKTTNIPGKKDPGRIHAFNPTTSLLT